MGGEGGTVDVGGGGDMNPVVVNRVTKYCHYKDEFKTEDRIIKQFPGSAKSI